LPRYLILFLFFTFDFLVVGLIFFFFFSFSGGRSQAKDRFEKQKRVEVKAREEFQRARETQNAALMGKLTKKVEKETRAAEKCDQEYADAVKQAQEQQARVYEQDMPRVLTDLEVIELECATGARDLLMRFADARTAHAPRLVAVSGAIGERAKKFVPQSYIQAFCDATRTGVTARPHAVYEPFDGNSPSTSATTSGMGGPPSGINGSLSMSMIVGPGGAGGPASPMIARPGGPPPQQQQQQQQQERCRALYDYDAQDESELSFKAGDIMTVLQKDESGWWQCQVRGQIGMAPSNFCGLLPPGAATASPQQAPQQPPQQQQQQQQQPGYSSQQPGYTSSQMPPYGGIHANNPPQQAAGHDAGPPLPARSVPFGGVAMVGRGPPLGSGPSMRGGLGGPPANAPPAGPPASSAPGVPPGFVPQNPSDPAVGTRVRALYDYQADGDDEVSLREGDEMTVLDNDGGWFVVVNPRGRFGRAPSNFCEAKQK
jgi:hypothetical protein